MQCAMEELNTRLLEPLFDEMTVTAFVDSNHAHDKIMRRLMMRLLIFIGRMPVSFLKKRQGAIKMSTYLAEFCAMRITVDEIATI